MSKNLRLLQSLITLWKSRPGFQTLRIASKCLKLEVSIREYEILFCNRRWFRRNGNSQVGVIGFGRVVCGSSAQHFLLLCLFSFYSSGKLIFMHTLTLHWDSLTRRLSASAYYTSPLFYPIQYISLYAIWPLNLPWNISRACCWKTRLFLLWFVQPRLHFHDGF